MTDDRSSSPSSRTECEREVAEQPVETVDVRVERLAADPELTGQRRQGQGIDTVLVDERRRGGNHRVVVEPHLRGHVPGLRWTV